MIWWEVILRIFAAMLIGAFIGAQREYRGNSAGLRTHTLVAMGACIAMITNEYLFKTYSSQSTMDIARMGSYVITGIGFLGAGSIIKDGQRVRGLTTAAGLWVVACLGIAVGSGFYIAAGVGTMLVLLTVSVLKWFEKRYLHRKAFITISFKIKNSPKKLADVLQKIGEQELMICNIDVENSDDKWMDVVLTTNKVPGLDISSLGAIIEEMPGIKYTNIEN